jgi:hypothetical protein
VTCANSIAGDDAVRRERGIDYGAGNRLDAYIPETPQGPAAVLLRGGSRANEQDVFEPLARRIATASVGVMLRTGVLMMARAGEVIYEDHSLAQNEGTRPMALHRIVLAGGAALRG